MRSGIEIYGMTMFGRNLFLFSLAHASPSKLSGFYLRITRMAYFVLRRIGHTDGKMAMDIRLLRRAKRKKKSKFQSEARDRHLGCLP